MTTDCTDALLQTGPRGRPPSTFKQKSSSRPNSIDEAAHRVHRVNSFGPVSVGGDISMNFFLEQKKEAWCLKVQFEWKQVLGQPLSAAGGRL